ncbi:glycosyltransferase family 39 protein [Patescibacteria group bacterium]|nr:glycosyltransferase family 39 protein [Patescibacteria group bacterium]
MFLTAVFIGVYSYLIFFLGIFDLLYKNIIIFSSLVFAFVVIAVQCNNILLRGRVLLLWFKNKTITNIVKRIIKKCAEDKLISIIVFLFAIQMVINLVGALGPELGFDALWYHLTIPKIYLLNHKVFYIPGGLLYYSAMPKLTEMIYIAALSFRNAITAKLIHFSFGLLTCFALYKLSRKFFKGRTSILVVLIFYSNLVVDWQSITAYVDLARAFFETMALWGFINWLEEKNTKRLIIFAIMLGFAISVKLLAIGSLLIFTILIIHHYVFSNDSNEKQLTPVIINLLVYWYLSLLMVAPWFISSFVNTGSPIYPFFSNLYKISISHNLFDLLNFIRDIWLMFTHLSDPISPVYIAFLPLVVYFFKKFSGKVRIVSFYSALAIIVWYFTPRTGGGRFILPYLPAFSIVAGAVLEQLFLKKNYNFLKIFILSFAILVSLISIVYRGAANYKYIPVILHKETKQTFLVKNLNFSFGDFYDIDKGIKRIVKNNNVLLYGFHNLYYVDFPFADSSWIKNGHTFNYIAVQNGNLPRIYLSRRRIYYNGITHVSLYEKPIKK